MALERITTNPTTSDFTPLTEHEEQTPASFFDNIKPVLHNHTANSTLKISSEDLAANDALATLHEGDGEPGEDGDFQIGSIDAWATSTSLILWNTARATGVKIPYQAITVHAQEGTAVFLGLNLSDQANTPDEDLVFVQMRIIPSTVRPEPAVQEQDAPPQLNGHNSTTPSPSQALFDAISSCQELNPDPAEDGDEDDEGRAFGSTAPGTGGWITSENMADFMDENGGFIMPGGDAEGGAGLGDGAGIRRAAEEDEAERSADTKWQRTG